jgi:hypothetical protein
MAPPSTSRPKELSLSDCKRLTKLLRLPPATVPTPQWFLEQKAAISGLSHTLLRPAALLPRLAMSLTGQPQKTHFCQTHKALNPYLFRRIFLQVSSECTTHIQRLVNSEYLEPQVTAFVKRMQSINSLWMSPDLYRVAYQAMPSDPRYERIESNCEGCILAAVGGSPLILSDLRTSMLGRKKKKGRLARLLRVVEAWINWMGNSEEIREESDVLAQSVRACRRQMQMARRQLKRCMKEDVEEVMPEMSSQSQQATRNEGPLPGEIDEMAEHDIEGSIINSYAQSILLNGDLKVRLYPTDIHPAFRNSLPPTREQDRASLNITQPPPYDKGTAIVENSSIPQTTTVPLASKALTAYSDSIYSTDSDVEITYKD